jgi:hypothetical protein
VHIVLLLPGNEAATAPRWSIIPYFIAATGQPQGS